jgi:hypothetical protein
MTAIVLLAAALSSLAFLYLLGRAFGFGPLLPEPWDRTLTAMSVGVFAATAFLLAHQWTRSDVFLVLAASALPAAALAASRQKWKQEYAKRWGKPLLKGGWICKACGSDNGGILMECNECRSPRPSAAPSEE